MQQAALAKSFLRGRDLFQYSGLITFIGVALFFSLSSSFFLTAENVLNILVQSSALGIAACGLTAVLMGGGNDVIKGGMDLSIANNLAFNTALTAVLIGAGHSFFIAFGIACLCSIAVGIINAFTVVKFGIIPLLATLVMMYLLQGIELLLTKNTTVSVPDPILNAVANGKLFGIPVPIIIFAITVTILHLVFSKSQLGQWVHAVGGNTEAARSAGINIKAIVSFTYIIAGVTAAVASLLVSSRIAGSVPGIGDMMLMDILLAGLLSSIFTRLSIPNIPGTIVSAIFVGMLTNGFTLIHVPTYWIYAIKGVLILVVVSVTTIRQRRASSYA
ncbi:ABC transporter permease [Bacillus sp. FJAT-50079]|uniref:ABC transporter permease n=1 Tax=Bacillus sp. FJAT-50079 TaxID=2833577 RepID=UPI001BC8CB5E|nr:ABC transporter permease [Bacillus sp. FJAT-50079]MBS4206532.1 ABC transporter permease [Bacillus sp. FJAT-50079]